MKKNNKGFVVSAVLYPLLVLFLALIMGLLAMTDTRKRILDKMKLEISDSIFDEATCSCDTILNKLNYIIKNGVGGGGGGSYTQNTVGLDVKGYEDPSSMPNVGNSIGDIAVITDIEIANYFVSSKVPESPKPGTVWIVQDIISNYYIMSDYSKLGISYAMQYVCDEVQKNCEWQLKKAYVYDDAKWVLLYYVPLVGTQVDLNSSDINAQIVKEFDYTGDVQEFHATFSGIYNIELWGASGGNIYGAGLGAYTKGQIYLEAGDILYMYVGGTTNNQTGGWNGGGAGHNLGSGDDRGYGYGGGGATDVRLVKGSTFDEFASLKSRIMVAAGGGGDSRRWYNPDSGNYYTQGRGGAGGGLTGYSGYMSSNKNWSSSGNQGVGGTQGIAGYRNSNWNEIGSFGIGATKNSEGGAGGGGGYYGGGPSFRGIGAGGGSSYISGHDGCVSIKENSVADNIEIDGGKYHYSGYYFSNTEMIDGNGYKWSNKKEDLVKMPTKDGTAYMTGNLGNGYAKVTLLTVEVQDQEKNLSTKEDYENEWTIPFSSTSMYSGTIQTFIAKTDGTYNIELWGAAGGNVYGAGYGSYTSGEIFLKKGTKLYITVGGTTNNQTGGWNGGGAGHNLGSGDDRGYGYGGGGATDVRLIKQVSSTDFESLKSRIMVAAGGGGDSRRWYNPDSGNYYSNGRGGAGGGLTGYSGFIVSNKNWSSGGNQGTGASQTISGYRASSWKETGSFGIGASNLISAGGAGGGGGYYGGGSGIRGIGSGGGSSYISGHAGSQSIAETSISTNIINTGSAYHYSGYYFENTRMIDGNGYSWTNRKTDSTGMPTFDESTTMTGNNTYGNAKINLISKSGNLVEDINSLKKDWNYTYAGTDLYSGNVQEFTVPKNGIYNIQLWGAAGGNVYGAGYGSYTSGDIYLEKNQKLYIYVGGTTNTQTGGWNGGGTGHNLGSGDDRGYGYGGGGATDIRLVSSSSAIDFESLKSRIMVAAGGGGDSRRWYNPDSSNYYSNGRGGAGGGLIGNSGYVVSAKNYSTSGQQGTGGSQTLPGYRYNSWSQTASFGIGASHLASAGGAGGGGGYYGGGSGIRGVGGGGGSSYISGHTGVNSISEDSTSENIIHTGEIYHYSGKYFENTKMIDGNGYEWKEAKESSINMPTFDETTTMVGNSTFGYAHIKLVSEETKEKTTPITKKWHFTYAGESLYKGKAQEFTVPTNGIYEISLWGASGASANKPGGTGAYTKGDIYLEKGTKLYVYVGGTTNTYQGGWNGGGSGVNWQSGSDRRYGYGGGGATDIRLASGDASEFDSLKTRIMVAAGGGGASTRYYTSDGSYYSYGTGGDGGALTGYSGSVGAQNNGWGVGTAYGIGATQNMPGYAVNSWTYTGKFGIGSDYITNGSGGAGGGGGYYGGGTSGTGGAGAGGGSSYISGHLGCNSISKTSMVSNIVHNGQEYHYSGYYFTNTQMIDGRGFVWTNIQGEKVGMPTFDESTTMTGNGTYGNAIIKLKEEKTKEIEEKVSSNWNYSYTGTTLYDGKYQEFIAPSTGVYRVELWGARGTSIDGPGGNGAYTKGEISLTKGTKLYIYVGGISNTYRGGWNGGGTGMNWQSGSDRRYGYGGGGATDIRTDRSENWDDIFSLKSRIMVAAGGGGASTRYYTSDGSNYYSKGGGGAGGGLIGYNGYLYSTKNWSVGNVYGTGGTQTSAGYAITNDTVKGDFGIGSTHTASGGAGGGGGYYGGGTSTTGGNGAGGGSSYISGHEGCIAITSTGNPLVDEYTTLTDSYHFSNYTFSNTLMIDGAGYKWTTEKDSLINMPTFDGTSTMTGNTSYGYAKITKLD